MTLKTDDYSLVAACRSGNAEAFGILVKRYQDRLFPTILRLTGNADDALDLLQDTFFRAYQKLGKFRGRSSFYTWLYRIAVNLALSDRRKRRTSGHTSHFDGGRDLDPPDDSDLAIPSGALERAETHAEVQAALNALLPDHRAVVVMKEFDGFRYEEIAEILNIPVGTVRSRLHRARAELRHQLKHLIEDEPARVSPMMKE